MAGVKQLGNPAGAWGAAADSAGALVMDFKASVAVTVGDVVILDVTDTSGNSVTKTTSAASVMVVGVVGEQAQGALGASSSGTTYAAGTVVPVIVYGPARVNVAALAVAASAIVQTSTTSGAVDDAAATVGTGVALTLESQAAKDAFNTIRCFVVRT